jgi:uncharacterized protein
MRVINCLCCVTAVIAISMGTDVARAQARAPSFSGFPSHFVWQNRPAQWNAEDHSLTITAGKKTDWFLYPGGGYTADSSPRLMFKAAADFTFSAKVDVTSHATYDAGCLALYESTSTWAKFCLEAQANSRLDVISVVTRGLSDDSTSFPASGTSIYLKIAKADTAIFFYASQDGKAWTIVRKLSLQPSNGLLAGFSAQSPDGNGASALFTDFHYHPQKVNLWDLR